MPAARTVHTSYRITGHSALTRAARPSPSCASATTGRRGGQERQQPEQVGGRGAERHRTHSSAGRRSASRHNRTPRGRGGASLVPPGDAGKADPQLEAAARGQPSLASGHRAGRERPATRTTGGVCPQPLRSQPNSKGLAAAPTRRRASVPEEVLINACLTVRPRATEGSQDRAGAAEPAASASRGRSLSPRTGVALPLSLLCPELRPFRATFPLGISHEGLGRPSTPHTAPRAPPRGGRRERGEAREAARMRKATASRGRKDGAAQAERGREVLPLFPPPSRGDWLR